MARYEETGAHLRSWRMAMGWKLERAGVLVSDRLPQGVEASRETVRRAEVGLLPEDEVLGARLVAQLTALYGHTLHDLPQEAIDLIQRASESLAIPGLLKTPVAA